MKKYIIRAVVALLALAMILPCLTLPLVAEGHSEAERTAYPPPLTASLADGRVIDIISYRNMHFLCLNGGIAPESVSLCYTGERELYLEGSGELVSPGQSFPLDMEEGVNRIYEYDSATNTYTYTELTVYYGSDIPALFITLEGGEDILDYIHADKENSTKGNMYMTDGEGAVVYNGALDTFKGRGNSSFFTSGYLKDKKSYNIKLKNKAELIPGAGKMKKWSLLHMRVADDYEYDFTGMGNMLAYRAYSHLMGEGYFHNLAQYVDVYINGVYRGAYILTQRVDINAALTLTDMQDYVKSESTTVRTVSSKDDPAIAAGVSRYSYTKEAVAAEGLDITGGYLLEVGGAKAGECGFITRKGVEFKIKAPEVCTKEQVQYISQYVQGFEDALFSPDGCDSEGKHYSRYADLDSLASMIVTYAFFQNWELFRTSTFIYVDRSDTPYDKLTFGPAWDFETGASILSGDGTLFGKHNTYNTYKQYVWLEQLWKRGDFLAIANEKAHRISEYMSALLCVREEGGITTARELVDSAIASLEMGWQRWGLERTLEKLPGYSDHDCSYAYYADKYIESLVTRLDNWDELWSESYLTYVGAEVKRSSEGVYTMSVTHPSEAKSYQWYSIDAEYGEVRIKGATEPVYESQESGEYFCVVTGANNAYYSGADGSVFSKSNISVRSAVLTADESLDELSETVTPFPLVWVFGAVAALAAVLVLLTMKLKKKSREK